MSRIWLRLRNVLNGEFVSDARPKPGGVRQTYVETVEKKSGKKKQAHWADHQSQSRQAMKG